MDTLTRYLTDDHSRLDALLARAVADPCRFDHEAYAGFRRGLLRHIGIEEKILMPDAKQRRGGVPLETAAILRMEHSAIALLLVPSPDHALVRELRTLLEGHNPREEGADGLYAVCERLAGTGAGALLDRARSAPEVPVARYHDGPRSHRTAKSALAHASRGVPRG